MPLDFEVASKLPADIENNFTQFQQSSDSTGPAEVCNFDTTKQKYSVGKPLGKGTCGTVCIAYDRQDKVFVALKKIPLPKDGSRKHILKYINLLRLFAHPCVNPLRSFHASEHHLYTVYQYCEGGSLADYISSSTHNADERVLFTWFWQLTSAVEYCHENGMENFHLKPENVLFDKEGNVHIADIGVANFVKVNAHGHCDAPEVSSESGFDGMAADMFSIGVILFFIYTRRHPFVIGHSESEDMIKTGSVMFPSHTRPEFKECFRKLTKYHPHARMSIKELKAHPFWTSNCEKYGLLLDGCHLEIQLMSQLYSPASHSHSPKASVAPHDMELSLPSSMSIISTTFDNLPTPSNSQAKPADKKVLRNMKDEVSRAWFCVKLRSLFNKH